MENAYTVSVDWLNQNLEQKGLKIVEAPWKADRYNRAHIKKARGLPCHSYLKAEDAQSNRLAYVFDEASFMEMLANLGINSYDEVVVYDDFHGLFAGRFWWVCSYYGFSRVRILDGGWHAWLEKGLPMEIACPEYPVWTDFTPVLNEEMHLTCDELKHGVAENSVTVWDTRRPEEYHGTEETNNARKGHIPGAINIEWKELLEPESYPGGPRYFKPLEEMEKVLTRSGFKKSDNVVTHCQASIRGAFGSLILEMLNYPNHKLYDAAMAEWANRDDTPLVIQV